MRSTWAASPSVAMPVPAAGWQAEIGDRQGPALLRRSPKLSHMQATTSAHQCVHSQLPASTTQAQHLPCSRELLIHSALAADFRPPLPGVARAMTPHSILPRVKPAKQMVRACRA